MVAGKDLVIADGSSKLYRLHVTDEPAVQLAALLEVDCPTAIVSPLCGVGKTLCGVDAGGKVNFFRLPDLKRIRQQALEGRCAWGPKNIGRGILLATDAGQLHCFDESGEQLWQSALGHGPLAGVPLAAGQHYLLAAVGGVVWRVDAKTGKEIGRADVGQPLATGPVELGERLVVGAHDGAVFQIVPPGEAK